MAGEATETILTWNFTNWITVSIMIVATFALVGFAYKFATRNSEGATA